MEITFFDDEKVSDRLPPVLGDPDFFEAWDAEVETIQMFPVFPKRVEVAETDDEGRVYLINLYDRDDVFEIIVKSPDDESIVVWKLTRWRDDAVSGPVEDA